MSPLVCLLAATQLASAWTADEAWRTVETEHYRIHYPLDTEAWALDLAARIDPMRERVADVVGWAPDRPTDVVVMDPWSRANGFALPFSRGPRVGVFPTAAPASSGIGNYRLWAEDLMVHEDVHILHLGRPSRNPLEHIVFDKALGVPAIAVKSPDWVIEGYATLVEGILTGAGRPNSDGRATFLRMLAAEGQLPTYGELDGSDRWQGRSMRYLVGSAYLEWLAEAFGDDRLPELWARMTARERRSFEAAFLGTFGASAAELYGRFVAELSAGALAVEPPADHAEVFLDLSGRVSAPAVSPDGRLLATVEKTDAGRTSLVVRRVEVDEDAVLQRNTDTAELLARDPLDVAPRAPQTDPHATEATLHAPLWRPETPRWVSDTQILFSAWVRDSHGVLQPDLFTWEIDAQRARRVTRAANLREAEPCGDFAVAVRRQHGLSHLVRVALDTGETTDLTAPSPTTVDAGPRLDAACQSVAWLRHDRSWKLMVAPLDALDGSVPDRSFEVGLPPGGQLLSADLHPDGRAVTAAIGTGGRIDLWTHSTKPDRTWARRTHQMGGAFDPEVTTNGQIYFLTTDPRGFDVVRLAADAAPPVPRTRPTSPYTHAVVRPPPVAHPPPVPTGTAPEPRPYKLGPQQQRMLLSAQTTRDSAGTALGLVVGDLVGRSELLLLAGSWRPYGDDTTELRPFGARAAWTHRRFPVHTTLDAWYLGFEDNTVGGGMQAHHHRRAATGRLDLWGGAFGETSDTDSNLASTARLSAAGWGALGPVVAGARLDADGRVGLASGALGSVTSSVFAGPKPLRVVGTATWAGSKAGPVPIRDVAPDLQADLRTRGTLWLPAFSGRLQAESPGVRHARADVRTLGGQLGVFGARLWADCDPETCVDTGPQTVLGTDLIVRSEAQPIGTVPGVTARAGIACLASTPSGTLDLSACAQGQSYAAWLAVQLQPGSPPAYPIDPMSRRP